LHKPLDRDLPLRKIMAADPAAAAKAMEAQQREEALRDMAATAVLVRNALIATLPVAPEQYLTLSVPGTVIDTEDIAKGGTYVYDTELNPFTPTAVRQAEAKLVDGMMPLANIMVRILQDTQKIIFLANHFDRLVKRGKACHGVTLLHLTTLYQGRRQSLLRIRSEAPVLSRMTMQ
jgi:hypothetical protein